MLVVSWFPSLTSNFHLGKLAATANSCSGSHGAAPQRRLGPAGSAQVGHFAGSLPGPRALLLATPGHRGDTQQGAEPAGAEHSVACRTATSASSTGPAHASSFSSSSQSSNLPRARTVPQPPTSGRPAHGRRDPEARTRGARPSGAAPSPPEPHHRGVRPPVRAGAAVAPPPPPRLDSKVKFSRALIEQRRKVRSC